MNDVSEPSAKKPYVTPAEPIVIGALADSQNSFREPNSGDYGIYAILST